jgi:hypothetical protein
VIKASSRIDSILAKLAHLKPSQSRLVTTLILTLFLSGFQGSQATAAGEIDIASMSACPVSLENVWGPFGMPYPCFTDGTALKVVVPSPKDSSLSIRAIVNGETFTATRGSFFTLSGYDNGLNEIVFEEIGRAHV